MDKLKNNEFFNNSNNIENIDLLNFKYIYQVFTRRKRIFIFSTLLSFSFALIYTSYKRIFNPIYSGSFELLISDPIAIKESGKKPDLGNKPDAIFDYVARSTDAFQNDIPTIIEYLKSEKVLNQLSKKYKKSYSEIFSNISVKIVNNNLKDFDKPPDVLKVSLKSKKKDEGLKILKSISDTYLKSALRLRVSRLSEGLDFLDSQEPLLRENTSKLRQELAFFREKNNLLDPQRDAIKLKDNLDLLNAKVAKLESEKKRLVAIKEEIKQGKLIPTGFRTNENEGSTTGGEGLSITSSDQSLLEELLEIKSLYAKYLTTFTPNSQMVLGLKNKINYLEPLVLKKQLDLVNSAIELKKGLINNAKEQIKTSKNDFSSKPNIISQYNAINDKLELAIQKEKALVKARENFQLEITQRTVPWIIIKEPRFGNNPVEPNIFNNLLNGLLFSLILAFIISYLREIREDVFHFSESVADFFDSKILTDIPFLDVKPDKKISFNEKIDSMFNKDLSESNQKNEIYKYFYYKEALQNLYTSIITDKSNKGLKIISTNSSIFGEGKSFINSLIAKVFSYNGMKVLLIDADLRKPTLHKNFLLENNLGLSNLLNDKISNIDKYLNNLNSNFSIITSGTKIFNPTKILSSPKMNELIKYLRESNKFDLIIFDTPPCLGLSDYKLISRNLDGLIFLVALGYVKRYFAKNTFDEIKNLNFKIIGILTNSLIVNQSDFSKNPIYRYYGNFYEEYLSDKNNINKENKVFDTKQKNNFLNFGKLKKLFKKYLKWLDN